MYVCETHGRLNTEWCDECNELVLCDCKEQEVTRFKDLIYDCEAGERTITIYLHHCMTCGEVSHVEI